MNTESEKTNELSGTASINTTSTSAKKSIGGQDAQKVGDLCDAQYKALLDETGLESMLHYVRLPRFLVTSQKLIDLKGKICNVTENGNVCGKEREFTARYGRGSVLQQSWRCSNNHCGTWVSSEILKTSHNNNVYVNDVLLSSSVLLSGNNVSKFSLCKALNLEIPEVSCFINIQKHYTSPVVLQFWKSSKEKITNLLSNYKISLSGDGRSDSPGHSARYCTHILMKHFSKTVVDFDVVDKRETKGVSANMEIFGLQHLLLKLKDALDIAELITDASTSIAKLVANLKGEFNALNWYCLCLNLFSDGH